MYYYEIYVENNRGIYTYKSEEKYEIGQWCIVNFINRDKMGLVIAITEESKIQFDVSKIKRIKAAAPVLSIPNDIMQLIKWIRSYYISDYYNVIKAVYPGALKLNYSKRAIYQRDFLENECLIGEDNSENGLEEVKKFNEYMKKRKEVTVATLKKNFSGEIVEKAISEKVISVEKKVILNSKISKVEKKKSEIIEKEIILNDEQQKAVDTIKNSENQIFLLKGITGSGKTEIYINLIKEALKQGFGSIFLVPEISLTVQMIQRLEEEFCNEVAILHSKLTDKEKREEWTFIRNGEKKIVIGARSAIFAPVQNLKYIIVDEEHENTYKQENNPRYHVKNVAIKRAFLKNENLKKDDVSAEHQEAIASRIYFQELYSNSFKRFDEDGVNSALNYGYMILRVIISSKIVAKGFHPSLGLHHKSQFNAYNFSDDIIEVFRPMVDYLVYMYKDILNEVKLSKEIRQKILLVAQQKVLFNNKKYDFFQAVDYYLDSIRNYFVKDEEVIIPTLSVMDYEY